MTNQPVGVNELKSNLSEYLRRVKQGEAFLITKNGKPIARLEPVQPPRKKRLPVGAEAGLVEWDGRPYRPKKPVARNRSRRQLADLINEARDQDL